MIFFELVILVFICLCIGFIAGVLVGLESKADKLWHGHGHQPPDKSEGQTPPTGGTNVIYPDPFPGLTKSDLLSLYCGAKPSMELKDTKKQPIVELKKFKTFPEIIRKAEEKQKKKGKSKTC